jgi:hypothetical protein
VYDDIPITFAPEGKLTAKTVRKAANEYNLFAPTTKWDEIEALKDPPFLDCKANINAIAETKIHYNEMKA